MSGSYPWLEPVLADLAGLIEADRVPHAILICGPPGIGKGMLAVSFASLLLCEARAGRSVACGRCTGCRQFSAGTQPDYIRVTTAEDASVIRVDQIRALAAHLALSSQRGGYKVAVLEPAEAMNINAANSLLKTLEEPSDNTVLVLVCAQPALLPATIRSRCRQLPVRPPDADTGLAWLAAQQPDMDARAYLAMAGGAPLAALAMAGTDMLTRRRQLLAQLAGILDGQAGVLQVAQDWMQDEQQLCLGWLRDWLMDLLRIRMTGDTAVARNADLAAELARLAGHFEATVLFRQLDHVNQALRPGASGLNRQLLTEDVLLAWAAGNG